MRLILLEAKSTRLLSTLLYLVGMMWTLRRLGLSVGNDAAKFNLDEISPKMVGPLTNGPAILHGHARRISAAVSHKG